MGPTLETTDVAMDDGSLGHSRFSKTFDLCMFVYNTRICDSKLEHLFERAK